MGTKMVFGTESSFGTIGGGHLEYRANMIASRLLAEQKQSQQIETFPPGQAWDNAVAASKSTIRVLR